MLRLTRMSAHIACGAAADVPASARRHGVAAALIAVSIALAGSILASPAPAQELKIAVADLLDNHKRLKAAEADVTAARERSRAALKDWFPDFELTANYGYERQKKGQGEKDSYMPPREIDLKLTQLLWDFGKANAAIEQARLAFEQAQAVRAQTRQSLMLEGVTAYLNLLRASRLVEFARASEANIKRQAELEDARVQRGSGFSTDVLQAKTQLAGAQSKRAQTEGGLNIARNRFRAVFSYEPVNLKELAQPRAPLDQLPTTIEGAVETAVKDNPQLKAAKIASDIAREAITIVRAEEFLPKLNAVGESKHKEDVGGTIGGKTEQIVKVELTYKFDMGFTAVNSLRAAKQTHLGTESRYADTRDVIEEQARNSWEQLLTAKANFEYVSNQANIAAEFLELARKERALGNRSLIDVLAGETSLINAQIDAVSAETDVSVAVFTLLSVMGGLSVDILK
ncbi:MAG: outer membrane efflux protein [Rhodospirillales bacterium]|nr:outer membrane efflux protein [Rhodospirillales bacterium]